MDNKKNRLLECYKFILKTHFAEVNLEAFLNFTSKNSDDFNMDSLSILSEQIGLLALEKKILATLIPPHFLPCIVFDNLDNAYVFIKTTQEKKQEIYDPIKQETIYINHKELKRYKKAILIVKDKKPNQTSEQNTTSTSWFYEPIKSFWRSYIEIGLLTFFINLFALFVPLFTMIVYDRVVPNQAYETLFVLSFGLVIALIFELVFKSARSHIIDKISKKLSLHFEEALMRRILLLQSSKDELMIGSKVNLFRELATLRDFFGTKSIIQLIDFPFFVFAILAIYIISPIVALVPFVVAILILLINVSLQIPISKLSKEHTKNIHSKHNYLVETIQAKDTLKLSNAVSLKL